MFDKELFIKLYPAFANLDTDVFDYYIADALRYLEMFSCFTSYDDTLKNKLWFLAVAHALELRSSGAVGSVLSANQGSVSVSFDVSKINKNTDSWLAQTPYGVELARYLNCQGGGYYVC